MRAVTVLAETISRPTKTACYDTFAVAHANPISPFGTIGTCNRHMRLARAFETSVNGTGMSFSRNMHMRSTDSLTHDRTFSRHFKARI